MQSNPKKKTSINIENTAEPAQTPSYAEQLYEFAKDPEQLREIYLHLKYLNNETLQLLFEKRLPKSFFEEVEKPKKRLVMDLIAQKFSDDEITRIVSLEVQKFLSEYETTGKVTNRNNLSQSFLKDEEPVKPIPKIKANIFKYAPAPLFKIETGGAEKIQKKIVKIVSKKKTAKLKR
jgi:hypothetical protein